MKPARRSPQFSTFLFAAALGLMVEAPLLTGCQRTAKIELPVAAVFDGARTYAWSGSTPALERVGGPAEQDRVEAQLRKELDGELLAKGFEKASVEDARFHASIYLGVEKDLRTKDPLFSVYSAERIERGHALLTLTPSAPAQEITWDRSVAPDPEGPAWIGSTEIVLRVTARGMGQTELRWTGTEEPRDWRVSTIAASLGKGLPD